MINKTILIGGSVVVLLAGGVYAYQAQQFNHEAQEFITVLNKMKPSVTFDKIEVDKYTFNIHLTNLKLSTAGLNEFLKEFPKLKEIPLTIPNISLESEVVTQLSYNPLTKTATFKTPNDYSAQVKVDEKIKTWKVNGKGDSTVVISFKNKPDLLNFNIKHFLANITEILTNQPSMSIVDENGKKLLSHEGLEYKLSLTIPDNIQEDVVIKYTDDMKNLKLEKSLFELPLEFIKNPELLILMKQQMEDVIIQYAGPKTGKGEVNFKIKKEDLVSLIDHVKNNIANPKQIMNLPHGFPSLEFSYELDSQDKMAKFKGDIIDIKYDQAHKDLQMNLDWNLNFSPKARNMVAQILTSRISAMSNPLKISEDMIPDIAAMGDIKFALNTHVNFEKFKGKAELDLITNQYKTHIKAHYEVPTGGTADIEIVNHPQLFADLKTYLERILTNPEIKAQEITPNSASMPLNIGMLTKIYQGLDLAKIALETMGKVEKKGDKTILKIEQPLPAGILPPMGQLAIGQ